MVLDTFSCLTPSGGRARPRSWRLRQSWRSWPTNNQGGEANDNDDSSPDLHDLPAGRLINTQSQKDKRVVAEDRTGNGRLGAIWRRLDIHTRRVQNLHTICRSLGSLYVGDLLMELGASSVGGPRAISLSLRSARSSHCGSRPFGNARLRGYVLVIECPENPPIPIITTRPRRAPLLCRCVASCA